MNVELHVGYFDDTLPAFVEKLGDDEKKSRAAWPRQLRFLHVDCDLFSSTSTVFFWLGSRLAAGSVVVFGMLSLLPSLIHAVHAYLCLQTSTTSITGSSWTSSWLG